MLSMHSRMAAYAVAVSFSLLALSAQAQGDAERGRVLADTCKGCHAVETYTNVYPTYHVPRIGGQSEEYLIAALTLYRNGDRPHPTMTAQASSYDDQEIRDLAAYISSVVPPLQAPEPRGTAPDSAQTCKACHGEAGIGQITSYPYLAGQHQDYLEHSLAQYKAGKRKGPNGMVMQAQLMTLSPEDLKAIAAYYAQQEGLKSLPMSK